MTAHRGRALVLDREAGMGQDGGNRTAAVTALVLNTIPSNINSYEKLAVWVCQCLQSTTNGEDLIVIEGQGQQPKAQCQIGLVADGSYRFILSAYVPCSLGELNSSTAKTWMAAGDLATASPHANFGTN